MIVLPAMRLRDGSCVQLVGGRFDDERVRLEDPLNVAREWVRHGFRQLHVVDLDAASGRGSNASVVETIVRDSGALVQVGGGVRDEARVEELLDAGAARVVVGTRALEDGRWLEEMAERFPGVLLVAVDVRERKLLSRGWERTLRGDLLDTVERLGVLPLAGLLVTAAHREGKMEGPDYFLVDDVVEASALPVMASGGIASMADLRELADRGVAAAVVGMALYTGALDPTPVVTEFVA